MSGFNVLLIDGMNMVHRAQHGGKDLTTILPGGTEAVPIGAVYQFIRSACILHDEHGGPKVPLIVCWEGDRDGAGSWRRDLYPEYKAGRQRSGDIDVQVDVLQDLLTVCGWSQAWSPTHEADDTLATMARLLEARGRRVAIVTGDHDLHQCVTDQVHVVDPNGHRHDLTNNTWKIRDVRHRWTVPPSGVVDVKALMGDTSDHVPGAKGIGKMWAYGLIRTYGSLDALLAHVVDHDEVVATMADGTTKKSKTKGRSMRLEADRIRMFRRIVTTVDTAPLEFAGRAYDADAVVSRFRALRFASLLAPSILKTIGQIANC